MTGSSTIVSISDALATWDRDAVKARVATAVQLREEFVERFPISAWPDLHLESYALGQQVEGGTLCWWMEFHTRSVASMSGGSAAKHLIWRGTAGNWRYPKEYPSVEDAWDAVRAGFVEILGLGGESRFDEIDDVNVLAGAAALRSKLLYMYFPDELVPVTSKVHVDHFLQALEVAAPNWSAVRANRQLLVLLRSQPELADLSTQELGYFLYHWADPRASVRVVKIAPGEQARYWSECLAGKYICVGWDDVGDLSLFPNKESFREAFRERYPYSGNEAQVSRKANELWTLTELEVGDKVIANRGISEVLAVGTVTDEGYCWRPDRDEFRHTIAVDWDTNFARSIEPVKAWATTTISKVPAALYKTITGNEVVTQPVETDHVYGEVEQALARRGQVILYGPPGTGKTYTARRAAVWLLDGGSANAQAAEALSDAKHFASREKHFGAARNQARQVWFMVANPSHWAWSRLPADGSVDYSLGRLKRNYPRVHAGDLVVGYESTPTQRVVALARITGEYDPDGPSDKALTLEPVTAISDGLTWNELQRDPILDESEPVRFRCQGSLFALTTVEADRLLNLLNERDSSLGAYAEASIQRLTRITFHPSYSYEDFIEGFRPVQSNAGSLELALTDGIFKEVCATATADPEHRYVVVIDEINRGNIPKIFGELMTLIEKDKRGLTVRLSQSGDEFAVPPNVVIIATMNTADRSIHLLDTALRRRFAFIELLPDPEILAGATVGPLALDVFLENLNERIRSRVGRERQIGHALFYDDAKIIDTADAFSASFRHELLPLLQEYLYEDYAELAELLGTDVIDVAAERPAAIVDDPEALCVALADQFGAHAAT
jgi:5-methylcytosine-specific restriction enzyme B